MAFARASLLLAGRWQLIRPAAGPITFWRLRPILAALSGLAVWLIAMTGFALQVPPLQGRVNDRAELLSDAAEQRLTARLADYEKATGHQLAILTIPTLEGDPIEDFSIRAVEAWKLGSKGKDDGVLLLVVSKDHKMRIEVGYGLEGELTDANAGRIVRDVMAPRFRAGDYEGGIAAAVDTIIAKTGGPAASAGPAAPDGARPSELPGQPMSLLGRILSGLFKLAFFGLFGFVALFILFINRFGGPRSGGMYFGGGGYGGSGGGGFDSGGFSGGGGGFGGGGASGSW